MNRLIICQICIILIVYQINFFTCQCLVNWPFIFLLVDYFSYYLWKPMDNYIQKNFWWVWKRQWNRIENLKFHWFLLASKAFNCRLKLSVEHEIYEAPISLNLIAPCLKTKFNVLFSITFWLWNVWFVISQICFFMETINEEVDILNRILLVIVSKFLFYFSLSMPESSWYHNLIWIPHLLRKTGKCFNQRTLMSKYTILINLNRISLILDIILMKMSNICKTLQRRVHITCVP